MKLLATWWLAIGLFLGTPGPAAISHAASRSSGNTRSFGRAYDRLDEWTKASGLEFRWLKREEKIELSGRGAKVILTVDSRDAQFNGVQVLLLFPVTLKNGTAYLARVDLESTLQPLIFPPRNRSGTTIKTICLDPGHGGRDPGNRVGSNQEKKYVLLLAQELSEQLTRAGFKVSLTRNTDTYIELPQRPELAKRRNADLFLSLHFNAFPQNTVRGTEVYCLTPSGAPSSNAQGETAGSGWSIGNRNNPKNISLAYQVQKSLTRNLSVEDRGLRRARFWVLRDAAMPAILIEAGFMTHPSEGRKIFDPAYRRQIARAIVEGVLAYKKISEPTA